MSSVLKVWVRKLSAIINGTASRHVIDRSLEMVELLNSAQTDGDLVSDDTFPSSSDQVVDELLTTWKLNLGVIIVFNSEVFL